MLDKKQQQNQEKALLEDLYQRTNLTKEQASILTSLDHPVNAEFFRVYQILEEQELLALEIKKRTFPSYPRSRKGRWALRA